MKKLLSPRLLLKGSVGILLGILLIWVAHLTWQMVSLAHIAFEAESLAASGSAEKIKSAVHTASKNLSAVQNDLYPVYPVLRLGSSLPFIGSTIAQIEPGVTFSSALASAGDEILIGLEPAFGASGANAGEKKPPAGGMERITQAIQSGQPHFAKAESWLETAGLARSTIQADSLPEGVRKYYQKVNQNFDFLRAGIGLLQSAPDLMGFNGSQDYLLLAQNQEEIRATGGFISGIGSLQVREGKIQSFNLSDSYRVDDFSKDYPYPPDPIQQITRAAYWVTRDGNWSPDFPTAARQVQALYRISTGQETQGVIAFDQSMVAAILKITGPVQVPGVSEPVTDKNIGSYIEQAWSPEPAEGLSKDWWQHRKDFMSQLGSILIERALTNSDQARQIALAKMLLKQMESGHLLLYFNTPNAQAAITETGLDGGLHPGAQDFLMLVDSNMGFNKVDPVVKRSIDYSVDLSDIHQPVGSVQLHYTHTIKKTVQCIHQASYGNGTYQDMRERCYWDYWRLFLPRGTQAVSWKVPGVDGSQLLTHEDWPAEVSAQASESGTSVFSSLMVLPTASSETLQIALKLNPNVMVQDAQGNWWYVLNVQKQPGLNALPFTLNVHLPEGAEVLEQPEGWSTTSGQVWTWSGNLEESTTIRLGFAENSQGKK